MNLSLPVFLLLFFALSPGVGESVFGEETASANRTGTALKLNSERIEETFGSYGIEVLEHTPFRVSMLYSTHDGEKICRTFAIVSFAKPVAALLRPAVLEIKQGASLGATLKKAGWSVEKQPLYVGHLPAGPRFQKLARLEKSQELAFSIYELSARKDSEIHPVATIVEIHHPAYLTLDQLRSLTPPVPPQGQAAKIHQLRQLALSKMERPSTLPSASHDGSPVFPASPRIEVDRRAIDRARERISSGQEPFATYWKLAVADAEKALALEAAPTSPRDALAFHGAVQEQGIAARLLAYHWQLEKDEQSGEKAISLIDAWASADPLPGTNFDPELRFPNAGMDVARGMLPFVAAYDLLREHPALTEAKQARIEGWFRALIPVVKEGIRRWEENGDFGGQEFQNHHVAHVLGLALFGSVLQDRELIQFALDSPDNPKDYREILSGLLLMPGDEPHGGLRGKPLHAGEIQDRVRTNSGAGLIYCHLSLTLMIYTAEVLGRASGIDLLNEKAPGGESLQQSATFYSDFFRLRNARINGDYYFRDQPHIQNHRPFLGTFEVALSHWPEVPNLKAIVRSMDRPATPRSWLSYYGLPLLTHGVETP